MRDINEDLLKHPFNDELTFVAKRFGTLLREIVDTIDKYGLRTFHLGKHKRSAERFSLMWRHFIARRRSGPL